MYTFLTRISQLISILLISVYISGCVSSQDQDVTTATENNVSVPENNVPAQENNIPKPQIPITTATLTLVPPTTSEDGTSLPSDEIGGYKVYHGTSAEDMNLLLDIDDPNETLVSIVDLNVGTHYFSVTTYDIYGNEGSFSEIKIKDISST